MDRQSFFWGSIGIVIFIFSNGNWTIPVATWIAPVFLLQFLRGGSKKKKLWILFVFMILATKVMLNGIIPNSIGVLTYILTVYYALLWFLPYWAHSLFSSRIKGFSSTLLFPAAAVVLEYLNTIFFGSWGSIAYTQFGNLPLVQIVSITGIWGLNFIILWFGSSVDWCWKKGFVLERLRSGGRLYFIVLIAILVYGGARVLLYSPVNFTGKIVSFTPIDAIDSMVEEMKSKGFTSSRVMTRQARTEFAAVLDRTHDAIFRKMNEITDSSTVLLLWPEATVRVLQEQEVDFLSKGSDFAEKHGIYLLVAYYLIPEEGSARLPENKSTFYTPSGEIEFAYLKAFPTPGAEHKAGAKVIPVSKTSLGNIGTVICYDMDFTHLIHQAGKKKVDIMLVPAWDWKAIDPLHTYMAAFRGIENGFSVVRQTGEGLSMASDPIGRVMSRMDYFTSSTNVMISEVPGKRYPTLYSMIGDAFAWICGIVLFSLLSVAIKDVKEAE